MNRSLLAVSVMLVAASIAGVARGQTSYPMVMSLDPVAAQIGATTEHTVAARYNFHGAYQVMVSGEGVTGEIATEFKPVDEKTGKRPDVSSVKVKFTVAPGTQPGVRDFRIATPQGVSTLGQVVISRDPVAVEKGDNNSLEKAQEITLPATVCGTIERNEDLDFFKFQAKGGSSLTFHVYSQRLQDKIHDLQQHSDPIITLRNPQGSIVAQVDNYFFADPLLNYYVAEEGQYTLEIRDVRYEGNGYWKYAIEINDRPFVTNVYPLGVAPGNKTPMQPVGYGVPEKVDVDMPGDMGGDEAAVSLPLEAVNPVPVVPTELPVTAEAAGENGTPEAAQPFSVPAGINGRIESPGDLDCYAFEAKKGERFTFEVHARRHQSSLDSIIRVLDAEGKGLSENDDLREGRFVHADSLIENWQAPADGKYVLEIRDLHLRGGPEFVYFVEATRSEPYFELHLDTDKTILAPGGHGVIFARVTRKNGFQGEVRLDIEGLPEAVTASCGRIPAAGEDGSIVLTAAADAKLAVANVRVTGTGPLPAEGDAEPAELTVEAQPLQETYMPGGGRGHWPVGMHTVSISEPLDILAVKLSTTEVNLKPGESQKIDIMIERAEGFDKNVSLDLLYRHLNGVYADPLPKGVKIDEKNSKTLLTGKQTEGHITLTAAEDATPLERQQVSVMANVSINFVMKMTYASEPAWVTVAANE